MNFFETQTEKKYCESCRETLLSPGEIWKIELKAPGSGGIGLLSKGQVFLLCKKCFLENATKIENSIIKNQRS